MRIVIGDDAALMRDGLARLLADLGHDVVGAVADGDAVVRAVAEHEPDAAIVDIRMPPTFTDEGIVVAQHIRSEHPATVVLVLSNHVELAYATRLLGDLPDGLGYLLKERVATVGALDDALTRLRRGECVVDSSIVSDLFRSRRVDDPLATLSDREREVLRLMAEGLSNSAIGERLFVSERTVEGHVGNIFMKLGIVDGPAGNRRVLAVLLFLQRPTP